MWKSLRRISRENRKSLLLSLGVLVLGAVVGFLAKDLMQEIMKAMLQQMSGVVDKVKYVNNPFYMFWLILKNNIFATISMISFGFLTLGVFSFFSLFINGALIGFLMATYASAGVNPWKMFAVGMLPHGIFEFPAILIACATGIRLGWFVMKWLGSLGLPKEKSRSTRESFHFYLKDLPLIVGTIVVLLIVAATVESLVTPFVLQWFSSPEEMNALKIILP